MCVKLNVRDESLYHENGADSEQTLRASDSRVICPYRIAKY
jgi:hypothetical protein